MAMNGAYVGGRSAASTSWTVSIRLSLSLRVRRHGLRPSLLVDHESLLARSEELRSALTPPPNDAPDVCPTCRSWRNTSEGLCNNCCQVRDELSKPANQIIPISLYKKPSDLRDWLKYYKPNKEAVEPSYRDNIGIILGRYLLEHGDALRRHLGGFDDVCVVPSSTRPGEHVLSELYGEWRPEGFPGSSPLLVRGTGKVGHREMSDDAFAVRSDVNGQRILLLDDVYTTGGTAQSAASALQLARANVPAILVVARRLNIDFDPAVARIWNRQQAEGFDFSKPPFWESS